MCLILIYLFKINYCEVSQSVLVVKLLRENAIYFCISAQKDWWMSKLGKLFFPCVTTIQASCVCLC